MPPIFGHSAYILIITKVLSLSGLLCSSKQHLTTFPAFDLLFAFLEAETSLFSYSFLFWVLQHLRQWERLLLLGSNSDGFHRRDLSLMEMVDWMCFTSEGVGTTAAVRGLPTPLHPEKATPSSLSISLLLINSLLLIHFLTPSTSCFDQISPFISPWPCSSSLVLVNRFIEKWLLMSRK